jgi:hypothetical protein
MKHGIFGWLVVDVTQKGVKWLVRVKEERRESAEQNNERLQSAMTSIYKNEVKIGRMQIQLDHEM